VDGSYTDRNAQINAGIAPRRKGIKMEKVTMGTGCDGPGLKTITVICRVMGKVESWSFHNIYEAKANGSSATHIINWGTGEVWYPTIYENTWDGGWHIANPDLAAETIALAETDGLNPLTWDYTKIRRRTEDTLRKAGNQAILECAYALGVKIN
jgi:hypothetical protein